MTDHRCTPGDAAALARLLVSIDSRNPSLAPGGPGEAEAARTLRDVLDSWGFQTSLTEAAPGRPNLVARLGTAGGPALMLNGHLDVVGTDGMTHAPFAAEERDGRLYGRGATDMKGGVAAMCAAAWRAARAGTLDGEVIVAAVADEEWASIGTSALLAGGLRADAAIVTEPTGLAIAPAHRGFAWLEITVHGHAAHGSRYDIGVDAIRLAAHVLVELDHLERDVLTAVTHPLLGHASLHAATIEGGVGFSTYPDRCVVRVERRTLPGERGADAQREAEEAVGRVRARYPALRAEVTLTSEQAPSDVALDAPVVRALERAMVAAGESTRVEGLSAWTDAALLNAAGIPAVCYGPGDICLAHADTEWVDINEIERATDVLTRLVAAWTGGRTDGWPN
jgi:acetylornithine deacetylase